MVSILKASKDVIIATVFQDIFFSENQNSFSISEHDEGKKLVSVIIRGILDKEKTKVFSFVIFRI